MYQQQITIELGNSTYRLIYWKNPETGQCHYSVLRQTQTVNNKVRERCLVTSIVPSSQKENLKMFMSQTLNEYASYEITHALEKLKI